MKQPPQQLNQKSETPLSDSSDERKLSDTMIKDHLAISHAC